MTNADARKIFKVVKRTNEKNTYILKHIKPAQLGTKGG